MKYKLLVLVALLGVIAVALTGCSETTASQDHSKIRVGIVCDIGGKVFWVRHFRPVSLQQFVALVT